MKKLYLSVDLEKDPWSNQVPVEETLTLLKLLDDQQVTFFVSGEIFDEAPNLVANVVTAGHEIGLHSYHHKTITSTDILRQQLLLSQDFIKLYKPLGFRAPQALLPNGGLEILKEFGFKYDSSSYFPAITTGPVAELAVSSKNLLPIKPTFSLPRGFAKTIAQLEIPYGSGLLTTLLPNLQKLFIDHSNTPSIIFIHPWQLKQHGFSPNLNLIPYAPSALTAIEYLCKHYKLAKMKELLNENQFKPT